MNDTLAGWLQILALVAALALSFRPLGDYMAYVLTSPRHWRLERLIYRLGGVSGDADQTWTAFLRSVLAFSLVSVLFLYGFLRLQNHFVLALGTCGHGRRPVVQHGRLLRDEYELAVVLG